MSVSNHTLTLLCQRAESFRVIYMTIVKSSQMHLDEYFSRGFQKDSYAVMSNYT